MQTVETDLVIIGTGLAGLCAALTAQEHISRIVLLSKGEMFASGSSFRNLNGRWGITYAATDQEKESLLATINAIAQGTNNQTLSRILVEESHQAFLRLRDWGVHFSHLPDGTLHRAPPCFGDIPLAAIIQDTRQCAETLARRLDRSVVSCLAETTVSDIEISNGLPSIIAAQRNKPLRISARAAILACGGNGATFPHHIVDPDLTGDGYGILKRLGVVLKNMPFQQMVWEDTSPGYGQRFSISYFFDGAYTFKNSLGERIRLLEPKSSLAQDRRRHVPISNLQEDRYFDKLLLEHIDATKAPIAVNKNDAGPRYLILPHVMASNGGVEISEWGETGIEGLLAAGEVTTGMHGGDRVGGTMIASCMIFGRRAALQAVRHIGR